MVFRINGGGGGLVAKSCPTIVTPWIVAHQAPRPWDCPGKNNGVGCHFLLQANKLIKLPFVLCYSFSLVAQMVKNLPTMQETQVLSLGGEDPLERRMATHSSILAWRIPWTKETGRLQSMGSQIVGHS